MKTVEEIYQSMMEVFYTATGVEGGSTGDLAVRLYAVAAEVYTLYVQADWVRRQCFPQTADGEDLEKHAYLRGLERQSATCAQGSITFGVDVASTTDRSIPAGTVCMTAALIRFQTTEDGVLEAGALTVTVGAEAVEAGTSGNVGAGTILSLSEAPVGVGWCTNSQAFVGGSEAETDEELRVRVLDTYQRMPNGANAAFYEQGALSFDEVAAAVAISRPRGVGTVDIIVTTASGIPSDDLLAELTEYFESRREIAVDLQVKAPEVVELDVEVQVEASTGVDVSTLCDTVETTIATWFDGGLLGTSITRAKLGAIIYAVDGVENYNIISPSADVSVDQDELPQLGDLSVEEMT